MTALTPPVHTEGGVGPRRSPRLSDRVLVDHVMAAAGGVLPPPHDPVRPGIAKPLGCRPPVGLRSIGVAVAAAPAGPAWPTPRRGGRPRRGNRGRGGGPPPPLG